MTQGHLSIQELKFRLREVFCDACSFEGIQATTSKGAIQVESTDAINLGLEVAGKAYLVEDCIFSELGFHPGSPNKHW